MLLPCRPTRIDEFDTGKQFLSAENLSGRSDCVQNPLAEPGQRIDQIITGFADHITRLTARQFHAASIEESDPPAFV